MINLDWPQEELLAFNRHVAEQDAYIRKNRNLQKNFM